MAAYTTDSIRSRREAGFTLLELMLALTIMAMVMVSVYSAFSAGSKACRNGSERAQIFHGARIAMQDIVQAIENVEFGNTSIYAFVGEAGKGSFKNSSVGDDTIEFATLTTPTRIDGRWHAGIGRVRYQINRTADIVEGKQSRIRLEKQVTTLNDEDFRDAYTIELAPNVVGMSFKYMDDKDFEDDWDSEEKHKLPETVEITMYVSEESSERVHLVRSAAMIPSMVVRQGSKFEKKEPEVFNPALQQGNQGGGSGQGGKPTDKPGSRRPGNNQGDGRKPRPGQSPPPGPAQQ